VARYYSATTGAFPLLLLPFEQFPNTILLNELKVLDHAHPIASSVALVDIAELLAGKIIALITVFHLAIGEQITSLFEEGTILISGSATDTIRDSDSLVLDIVL
jgi:hypothetical protein